MALSGFILIESQNVNKRGINVKGRKLGHNHHLTMGGGRCCYEPMMDSAHFLPPTGRPGVNGVTVNPILYPGYPVPLLRSYL